MPAKPQELRSDKQLLDVDFQGYKLSLAEVSHHSHELPVGRFFSSPSFPFCNILEMTYDVTGSQFFVSAVHKLEHSGDQFSYLFLSLFSMQNHLIVDPCNDNSLYFVNENSVITKVLTSKIDVSGVFAAEKCSFIYLILWLFLQGQIDGVQDLLAIPSSASDVQARCYNSNLLFASSSIAVISDGECFLHIVNTGSRSLAEEWTVSCFETSHYFCFRIWYIYSAYR